MTYEVYTTKSFEKEMSSLSEEYQRRIKNIFLQMKENPYTGDPLQSKILREKRLEEKRVYYLVFEDLKAVLFVAISDKKTQQKTINFILEYINEYKAYLKELLENN